MYLVRCRYRLARHNCVHQVVIMINTVLRKCLRSKILHDNKAAIQYKSGYIYMLYIIYTWRAATQKNPEPLYFSRISLLRLEKELVGETFGRVNQNIRDSGETW